MTDLIAKSLNEKLLKTNDTFIHQINKQDINIAPENARLIRKLLKSKDMTNFKAVSWSKALEIVHNWTVGAYEAYSKSH